MNNKLRQFFKPLCTALALFCAVTTPIFAAPKIRRCSHNNQNLAGTYEVSEGAKSIRYSVSSSGKDPHGNYYSISVFSKSPFARKVYDSQIEGVLLGHFQSNA